MILFLFVNYRPGQGARNVLQRCNRTSWALRFCESQSRHEDFVSSTSHATDYALCLLFTTTLCFAVRSRKGQRLGHVYTVIYDVRKHDESSSRNDAVGEERNNAIFSGLATIKRRSLMLA
jgi:hypothetical protein